MITNENTWIQNKNWVVLLLIISGNYITIMVYRVGSVGIITHHCTNRMMTKFYSVVALLNASSISLSSWTFDAFFGVRVLRTLSDLTTGSTALLGFRRFLEEEEEEGRGGGAIGIEGASWSELSTSVVLLRFLEACRVFGLVELLVVVVVRDFLFVSDCCCFRVVWVDWPFVWGGFFDEEGVGGSLSSSSSSPSLPEMISSALSAMSCASSRIVLGTPISLDGSVIGTTGISSSCCCSSSLSSMISKISGFVEDEG